MKKLPRFLFALTPLLLTSCLSFILDTDTTVFENGTLKLFDLASYYHGGSTQESAELGEVAVKYETGKNLIPYVSFEAYAKIIGKHFRGVTSTMTYDSYNAPIWQVNKDNQPIFIATISHSERALAYAGDLYASVPSSSDLLERSTLSKWATSKTTEIKEGSSVKVFYYQTASYTSHRINGEVYLPIGIFDMVFGKMISISHFQSGDHLFAYDDVETLQSSEIKDGGVTVNAIHQMSELAASKEGLPTYYLEYERDAYLSFLDAFYGMKREHRIDTFKAYSQNTLNIYDDFTNKDEGKRFRAYSSLLASLNDQHSKVLSNLGWQGEDVKDYVRSDRELEYRRISNQLKTARTALFETKGITYDDIEYSEDYKVAIIRFDSFNVAENAINLDGSINEEKAEKYDDFRRIERKLNAILTSGKPVKHVVLDISVNGGGYLYVMEKILALFDAHYQSTTYTTSESSDYLRKTVTTLTLGENNPYASSFSFYLLTSPCSFSCGNALPFYARTQGLAKTIGVNSGGGECTVETTITPAGRYFCFSSDNRIIEYTGSAFIHAEQGAGIDYPLDYADFYDIEKIESTILG